MSNTKDCGCEETTSRPANPHVAIGYQVLAILSVGKPAPIPDPAFLGNIYNDVTVYNATDHDLKYEARNTLGGLITFIVPRWNSYRMSIGEAMFINTTVKLYAIEGEPPSFHKVIINMSFNEYVR